MSDAQILHNTYGGKTLEEAIREQGFDPSPIQQGQPALSQDKIDAIAAHFEVHIEQARFLNSGGYDIGVATSIRGTRRLRILVRGEAAHSGATPMGNEYRKDANLAMAYMLVELDKMVKQEIEKGTDVVQTAGIINSDRSYNYDFPEVYANALTKVSPFGYFSFDIRSNQGIFLNDYADRVQKMVFDIGVKYKVGIEIQPICYLPPIEKLDVNLRNLVARESAELNYAYTAMTSGALHDVAVVSRQSRSDGTQIPGALIFNSLQRWPQP